jgi:hypothetical protein
MHMKPNIRNKFVPARPIYVNNMCHVTHIAAKGVGPSKAFLYFFTTGAAAGRHLQPLRPLGCDGHLYTLTSLGIRA